MICVTLTDIRKYNPCQDSWKRLLSNLGKTKADDDPLPLVAVLDILGLDDAIWCLRVLSDEHVPSIGRFAVALARQALEQVPYCGKELRLALESAEAYMDGESTLEEVSLAANNAFEFLLNVNSSISRHYPTVAVTRAVIAAVRSATGIKILVVDNDCEDRAIMSTDDAKYVNVDVDSEFRKIFG
jgi:hypothetical protein